MIIEWDSPDGNGGDNIQAYRVAWAYAGTSVFNYTTVDANTTSYNISRLDLGTLLDIRVSARNSLVWSQNATVFQHPTLPPGRGFVVFGQPSFSVAEANNTLTVALTRRGGSDGLLVATVKTIVCSAIAASKFTPLDLNVSFGDLQVSRTFQLQIFNDNHYRHPDDVLCLSVESLGVEHGPRINVTLLDAGNAGHVDMTVNAVGTLENAGHVNVRLSVFVRLPSRGKPRHHRTVCLQISITRHAVFNDINLTIYWRTSDITAHSPVNYGGVASGVAFIDVGQWQVNISVGCSLAVAV